MMKKSTALIKLIGFGLGWNRTTKKPYRFKIIVSLFKDKTIKEADEIIVSSKGLTIISGSHKKDIMTQFAPLSDEEKETLCVGLNFILSPTFRQEKHYDPELPLSTQVKFHYIKTVA